MKLYTKTGDDGTTGLFGNHRVGKDSLRVEAYGTVDELTSFIGSAVSACTHEDISKFLLNVQSRLFELGADLSRPPADKSDETGKRASGGIPPIEPLQVEELETELDRICSDLPQMKTFIIPGGCELSSRLHIARTVCRRTERLTVALSRSEDVNPNAIKYLNRLSDLLFAYARKANQLANIPDTPWLGRDAK